MLQLGTNEDEAKVFRAHAVPQGLCEHLISALKLLANQQRETVIVRFRTLLRAEEKGCNNWWCAICGEKYD